MKKSKKAALMMAVLGLGVCSPIADNSLAGGVFEVNTAEAAVVTSVGEVSAFAKDSDPAGYLLCDGREVNRADYPELFAAIGTKYGEGDGKTTFNLPNLIDRFVEGSNEAGVHKEAGLPNITGSISGHIAGAGGAFQGGHKSIPWGQGWSGSDFYHYEGNFDASGSNPIYGKSDTVQPEALTMRYFIKATSKVQEDVTVDKDFTVHGHTDLKGDVRIEDGLQVKGNTQLGDDKGEDKVDVYAQTHLHGDTTIGDDDKDKLVVNATSEFKADATFDKNVTVHGDLTVDGNQTVSGDSHIKGNQTVDGNFEVGGDATVHGDQVVDGNSHIKGDSETDGDLFVHGNAMIDKNLVTQGDSYTLGNSSITKDLTVGGNSHLGGDLMVDGRFFAKGAAEFGDNLIVNKDLLVGGDAKVDGDIYGRSFNVGNERYIDANGINANNHKIRNVVDGEIGPNSFDAVNGRQLWNTREALDHNVQQVGAGAAAMANLHPLEFEHNDKLSVSAAVGNYKSQTSLAAGVFYRPSIKSMMSLSSTFGSGENMMGLGYSQKFGKVSEFENMSEEQLKDSLAKLSDDTKEMREQNKQLHDENQALVEKVNESAEKVEALTADNKGLSSKLTKITEAYEALQNKVDSLVQKIADLTK